MRTGSAARYRVGWNAVAEAFMIADEAMGGEWCRLPDDTGYLKMLRFRNAKAARLWLDACHKQWEGEAT